MKRVIQSAIVAATACGAFLLASATVAQPASSAMAGMAKRMFTSTLYEVRGTVSAIEIVNEEGSVTTASPNQTFRIQLLPTLRRVQATGVVVGTGDGPYCGPGTGYYAYANGNEPYARMIYNQALVARATVDSVTVWVEADSTGTGCHIYLMSLGVQF